MSLMDGVPGNKWGRLLSSESDNGAIIRAYYHKGPIPGEDPSDRILLWIRPADAPPYWWLMNIEDADTIMLGLDMATERARKDGVLTNSSEYRES